MMNLKEYLIDESKVENIIVLEVITAVWRFNFYCCDHPEHFVEVFNIE